MIARLIAAVALLGGMACASPAVADVVQLPPDSCSVSDEDAETVLITELLLPEGRFCYEPGSGRWRIRMAAVEWQPKELPVSVMLQRNRDGYRLYLMSRLYDRRARPLCWDERLVPASAMRAPGGLWKAAADAFDRWASTCPAVALTGEEEMRGAFHAQGEKFRRKTARLVRLPTDRFGPAQESVAIGSFLPTRVSQGMLDAASLGCGGASTRPILRADGAIDWAPDVHQLYDSDGSPGPDSCLDGQIRYWPGYRKAAP